jgi:hypothetical protein
MARGDTLLNAVVGAVVTVLLSFAGFSALLGGGVAGYLQREDRQTAAAVGALSGVFATVPFLFLVGFFFVFVLTGIGGGFPLPGGVELVVILFVLLPLLFLWNAALGAAGGYLGAYVREEYAADAV